MEVPVEHPSPSDASGLENDPDWILDSLVAYLRGPVWLTPIINFVEQNSVVFEGEESEQHAIEYKKIHNNFRNLVDIMLGAYMDDLGLQPGDLENALSQIQPSIRSAALQELLEPVQSAGDYERFKSLMRTKNEQLHNEALEMLKTRRQLTSQESSDATLAPSDEDFSEEEINEAIRQSLAEAAATRNQEVTEERQLDRALAASVAELLKTQQGPNPDHLPFRREASPITTTPIDDSVDIIIPRGKFEPPDPEEVERRRAALRAQRDKILSQKRKEHETKLQQQEQNRSLSRPRSGKAAQAALAGEPIASVDERTIQYRRLLLQKIKEEVEGQSK